MQVHRHSYRFVLGSKNTSVGSATPHSILVVRSGHWSHGTRRLAGRAVVQSACPSAPYSPRSCAPQPPREKRAKTHTIQRRRLCTFSRSVPTLYFVQFASFAHFFCCTVLPYAPSTSIQVPGTFCQRLLFSIFVLPPVVSGGCRQLFALRELD